MMERRVIALGFFDGVHRGHAALLNRTREMAQKLGVTSTVLTFENHPDELVFGRRTPLINTLADRRRMIARDYGIQEIISLPFDQEMMHTPWEVFVEELLVRRLKAVHVVCGHDFVFGYRGLGTARKLMQRCNQLGITCDVMDEVLWNGVPVSSTRIRGLLQGGYVEQANELLGHRHFITGTVVYGKQLGRTIGVPTANVRLPEEMLLPALGVYATEVVLEDGRRYQAVTNVGVCPTVEQDTGITIEPWLLDFKGDLYHQYLRIEFSKFLRTERRFRDLDELKTEIHKNAEETRAYYRNKSGI